MSGIESMLEIVDVIAFVKKTINQNVAFPDRKYIVGRQRRRRSFAHIGKDATGGLDAGIARMRHGCGKVCLWRLPRLIQTASIGTDQPPVIEAPQSLIVDTR